MLTIIRSNSNMEMEILKVPVLTKIPAVKTSVSPPGTTRPTNKPVSAKTNNKIIASPPHATNSVVFILSV